MSIWSTIYDSEIPSRNQHNGHPDGDRPAIFDVAANGQNKLIRVAMDRPDACGPEACMTIDEALELVDALREAVTAAGNTQKIMEITARRHAARRYAAGAEVEA